MSLQDEDYDITVCYNPDNIDGKKRSAGMEMIKEPYLKNYEGQYVNELGEIVTDPSKYVKNPAYLEQASDSSRYHYYLQSVEIKSGLDYMESIYNQWPKTRLILCYMSGFAQQMSTWVERNDAANYDSYAIFAGGVQGSEPSYLLGSLESGIGQTFTYSGTQQKGIKSLLRGAISFGGADAAKSLADLSKRVYSGTLGTDYVAKNAEALGVWFTQGKTSSVPDTLAIKELSVPLDTPVTDFDPEECIKNPEQYDTSIIWQDK